jgi:beta-lactamase regulating signal transducer with metallopeptidase domain
MTMNTWILHFNSLAAAWLAAIWRASWQGGIAFLIVWAVCSTVPRLPAQAKSWLWRLAYLKLLVAFFWAAPIGLPLLPAKTGRPVLAAKTPASISSIPELVLPSVSIPAATSTKPTQPVASTTPHTLPLPIEPAPPVHIRPSAAAWVMLAWVLGLAAFASRTWRDLRRTSRLRRSCSSVTDPALLQTTAELASHFGLRSAPALLISDAVSSPLLLGIFRPVIVLPSAIVSGSSLHQVRLMLAHEMAHLKRSDLWWVWLAVLGQGLFFFHPVLWLARREWRLAHEMSCDDLAVRMTRAPVSTYGEMLVGVAALNLSNRPEPFSAALGLHETKEMLTKRLKAMKLIHLRSTKRALLVTSAILTVGILNVLPLSLTAQQPPAPGGTSGSTTPPAAPAPPAEASSPGQPAPPAAAEPPAPFQNGPRPRAGFTGGGGFGGGGFAGRAGPFGSGQSASAPPTNVAPARFEATIYEVAVPENRITDLDAVKLESAAATPQALATALSDFGSPKILYKVDQTVNLYGENITLGSQEPMVTGTRINADGKAINTISYQNVGLITRISAAAPRDGSGHPQTSTVHLYTNDHPVAKVTYGQNTEPDVQLNFQLSAMADSGVELASGVKANRIRSLSLSQSGTPKFGKPSVLVTVSAPGSGEKSPSTAYIVRYRFTRTE